MEKITERQEIIVKLKNGHLNKRLRQFGTIIYVSRKMKYAILYVNADDADKKLAKLQGQSFVVHAEKSPRKTLTTQYESEIGEHELKDPQLIDDDEDEDK